MCAIWLLAACPLLTADEIQTNQLPPSANVRIEFDRDIQPVLATSCIRCHGPEKPKSHFRLDNREAALKGGDENTNDIVPGDSSKSLLINYVARQVPDMEMPPIGKGDPLTPHQIALLRAWIDQGAEWSMTNQLPPPALTFAPMLRWIDVQGNQSKFRELEGVNPGFSGGAQEFSFTQQTSPDEKISVSGHVIVPNQDIDVKLAVDKSDVGFVHAGFDEWRTYYNDIGGYDPAVKPPPQEFSLNRDLYVDNGHAWIDFGLTLPDQSQVVLGYEYQFQNGNKSMLDWGSVGYTNVDPPFKSIYPAMQAVDEHTHIIKLDVTDEFDDWNLANSARLEFYSANNLSVESQNNFGGTSQDTAVNTHDNYQSTQGMDTLMLEKQIRDWWFWSGGFYYSKLDASDFFNQTTAIPLFSATNRLSSQQITLGQQSEIFSLASLFTPLTYLTFSLGTQNEWTTEDGFGNSIPDLDLNSGDGANVPASSNSQLFKASQNASLRYTRIPFSVLFADGRFDQESVSQFQEQDPDEPDHITETQTDAMNYRYNFQTGFNTSPWRWVALNAKFQYQFSDTDYNYPIDKSHDVRGGIDAYPGFILNRKIKTDAFETKLDLRPANWVKTTLSYKIAGTDYSSITDPAQTPPGGSIMDGTFDTQTYGLSVTLTPIQRLYFYNAFTYTHSRAVTASYNDPSIVPYSGDLYTLNTTATYALNPKTSLQASYIFSYANYGQNNAVAGLPLGINFTRDEVIFGLTRQLTTRLSCALHYEFSRYDEPSSGDANNFTAQGVFATLVYKWQ